ncbi:MAG: flagellar basal body L-ring protein FlgH [Comamonadaceae bacterium]|nr:flagellar basal body L-ring protein FlgH [Comamonadaceae bacterium]
MSARLLRSAAARWRCSPAAAAGRLQHAVPARRGRPSRPPPRRSRRRAAAGGQRRASSRPRSYRPLFEDHRARLAGDTLTVQIVEKVSASQKSTSSIDKSGKRRRPASPRCPASAPSVAAPRQRRAAARATPSPARAPPRAATTSPARSPSPCASVLPNGHLLIAGEKQIGVNANVDVLRFSGQVDPRADPARQHRAQRADRQRARSSTAAAAQQAEAQAIGWLSRVFLSVLPI